MKVEIRDYYPNAIEGEARELLLQALDWNEQKIRLDENPNKTILIKKPLEGHDFHYYFSIIKKWHFYWLFSTLYKRW